jgi:Flp pilus assembly protein TadD
MDVSSIGVLALEVRREADQADRIRERGVAFKQEAIAAKVTFMRDHLLQQFYAALLYDDEEAYENVIRELTEALAADPANAAARNNRAVAFWEIGKVEEALADFEQAIRLARGNPTPAHNCGMLLHKLKDFGAALTALDTAVHIAPENPFVRRTRARTRAELRDWAGAVEDFGRAIEVEPGFAQQYRDRAAMYDRLGKQDLAVQDRLIATRLEKPNS